MKIFSFRLILLCLCLSMGINAFAETVEINGIYYNLITKIKTAEVTSNPNKYTGDVNIPASVVYDDIEYNVNSIGNSAFSGCRNLNSVTIPNSVTSIGNYAFYNCSSGVFGNGGLTAITIPNSVTSIGSHAFDGCSHLTSITIPNNVTSFGDGAFYGCYVLNSVTIPEGVTNIGSSTFYDCRSLTSITIPNSVTSIGEEAFRGCRSLASVTIGDSVTTIGTRAFYGCISLTSITIPNSVKAIGVLAFYECSSLSSVFITNLEAWCNITFSDTPFGAAYHLYLNDEEITDLVIPNTMTRIGKSAFSCCSSLTTVTIPNSVTSIGSYAFVGCSGLTTVTIPNSVTSIGEYAFAGCSSLTSFTIPNGLTSIAEYVFSNCSSLTSITIPENVVSIARQAFRNCTNLTTIIIPNSVTSIDYYAFRDCSELSDVYCYAENVPNTNSDAFYGSYIEYATLHVPESSIDFYRTTLPWSNFGTIVTLSGEGPDPEVKKCATPTISYTNGTLKFGCETEGAEFISEITDTDIKKHYEASISLTATYHISVFAIKAEYENSDTIQATLCWIEQQPRTEGITDEDAVTEVPAVPVLIQTHGNSITVQGAKEGTEILLYSVNGMQLDSVIASKEAAFLNASRLSGSVAIVKIGDKAVKVKIK